MDLIYRFDPYAPVTADNHADSAEAIRTLCRGNNRFVDFVGRVQKEILGDAKQSPVVIPVCPVSMGIPLVPGQAIDQKPFVLILGCSDARVPVEMIFDLAFNDAFVVRLAGNVLGTECLGSINYAIRSFDSLKLIVVLGHSGCGAVSAAVNTYLKPREFGEVLDNFSLRTVVDRLSLAVRQAAKALDHVACWTDKEDPTYRKSLVETAVYLNAAITAFDLRREIESLGRTDIAVVFGVYDLAAMRVHSTADHTAVPQQHLATPPMDSDGFAQLAYAFAEGVRQRGFLE